MARNLLVKFLNRQGELQEGHVRADEIVAMRESTTSRCGMYQERQPATVFYLRGVEQTRANKMKVFHTYADMKSASHNKSPGDVRVEDVEVPENAVAVRSAW